MASLEPPSRHGRETLPSILDFEKYRIDGADNSRYSVPGLNTLTKGTLSSPPTSYSGPPPPYSARNSAIQSVPGYISPPESSSRRSTRDDKESPSAPANNSLPSISEALKSADLVPTSQSYTPSSAPSSATFQSFADAPRGPGNPFSQPVAPASALRTSITSITEQSPSSAVPPPPAPPDSRPSLLGSGTDFTRTNLPASRSSGPLSSVHSHLDTPFRSSYSTDSTRPGYPFPDYPATATAPASQHFHFESSSKFEDTRNSFAKSEPRPYNETVKRHLDIYDAELALSEVAEASAQTLEFARLSSQRFHQTNRTSYFHDGLPATAEVDEALKATHRILENLSRLREVTVLQQNAIHEQRARLLQGQSLEDDFHRSSEDFKAGGFAGGDAKKRRGKAAPPGRCHSCNRAETPEWRRGPDGARTLCNACGLHYAKLTRKMGANKAAVMTGSNIRPKSLSDGRP